MFLTVMPTPRAPSFANRVRAMWNTTVRILRGAAARMVFLSRALDIEGSELLSIFLCLSWYVPLAVYERLMGTSIYLKTMENDLPRPWLMAITGTLLLWQVTGIILGGHPSALLNTPRDIAYWLKWRRIGLFAAVGVWAAIGVLLTLTRLTPGTIVYGVVGTGSAAWGVWRLSILLVAEREARALRLIWANEDASRTAVPAT